jgi:hypothetical protein
MLPKLKEEHYTNLGGINQKASRYTTGVNEVLDLYNYDFSILSALTARPGTTQYVGQTLGGPITGVYEFTRLSGYSQIITTANTNAYAIVGGGFNAIRSGLANSNIFSFTTFVDRLFAADGQDFFKYDGFNTTYFSLPPGTTLSAFASGSGGSFGGVYTYGYGYVNDRGYFGPMLNSVSLSASGSTQVVLSGFTTPNGYGISAIIVYRTDTNLPTPYAIASLMPGTTTFADTYLPISVSIAPTNLWFTLTPNIIDIFNNNLLAIGFSSQPSTFYVSAITEPEAIGATAFIQVRTNDGDYLTAGTPFFSTYVMTKNKSCFSLAGTDITNLVLSQISNQYGCVSKRAICTFLNFCWFLDEKGVVQFDGANVNIVSNRMESTFRSMNVQAAQREAQMVHIKDRNEVWTAIPINGATLNNVIVVYDYVANAWGKFTGFNPSALSVGFGQFPNRTPFFGTYTGSLNYFGVTNSFADSGHGYTLYVRFPYSSSNEHSTEHFWRRIWFDLDTGGATQLMTLNLYTNQSSLASFGYTVAQGQFQTRTEFGLSSKDLSVELILSPTSPFRLNGYSVAHRFQREV